MIVRLLMGGCAARRAGEGRCLGKAIAAGQVGKENVRGPTKLTALDFQALPWLCGLSNDLLQSI